MKHKEGITAICPLRNGDFASGSLDTTIKIWEPSTGKCKRTLKGHTHAILVIRELITGHLVSSSQDRTIILWNRENGSIHNTLEGFDNPIVEIVPLTDTFNSITLLCNETFFLVWKGLSDKKDNLNAIESDCGKITSIDS